MLSLSVGGSSDSGAREEPGKAIGRPFHQREHDRPHLPHRLAATEKRGTPPTCPRRVPEPDAPSSAREGRRAGCTSLLAAVGPMDCLHLVRTPPGKPKAALARQSCNEWPLGLVTGRRTASGARLFFRRASVC